MWYAMSPGQRACEKTIVPITFLLPQQKKQATAMASASPFHALSPLKQASHAHQIQALYAMDPCFSILCSNPFSVPRKVVHKFAIYITCDKHVF